jgi:hypothetical protein
MEWVKTVMPLLIAVVTLTGGWIIGTRVTDRWDRIRKQRELDLAALTLFYQVYGEFIAIWKAWGAAKRYSDTVSPPEDVRWKLLERAVALEGSLEALLIKLAAERPLTDKDIDILAGLRQAYKSLRKEIRSDESSNWASRSNPEYDALKGCATYVNSLLTMRPPTDRPEVTNSSNAFKRISDKAYQGNWASKVAEYGLTSPK